MCARCFGQWEVEHRVARNAAAERDAVLTSKASRLGKLQGLNAGVGIILLAGWVHISGWLSSGLIAAVIVISYGIRLRSQLAFRAALVIDTVGSLAFFGLSVAEIRDGRLFVLLFPAVFSWWLGLLTWELRDAFVERSLDNLGE